jgi:serine/threonine-protein kinase
MAQQPIDETGDTMLAATSAPGETLPAAKVGADTIPAERLATVAGRPGASTAKTTTAYGLPAELISAGAKRLGGAALACALLLAVVFTTMNLTQPVGAKSLALANVVAGASITLSLIMAAITRRNIAPERLLDLGLGYEVVGALGIAMAEALSSPTSGGSVRGVSWVCIWIVLFPLVVPSTPIKTLWAGLASACMGPLALVMATEVGVPMPSGTQMALLTLPNFASAGLAMLFARVIHKLGTDVSRAREMGSYQLVELLGRGGMGEVWRAKHRMLAQPAAIKLVRPESLGGGDSRTILRRFEREARATAMLNSQHTVQLYDFGATDDGTLYYVMELLDGVDLETLVQRHGALQPERVTHFMLQACDSLIEAHAHGMVHRDIKPANIYACTLGHRHDCIKVLDFGLVGLQAERDSGATRLTAENTIPGTPAYLAPESITGEPPVNDLTDIYSLGCVAYWLLTGDLVFEGKSGVQLLYSHVDQKPERPSRRAGVELPPALEDAVLDCLKKERDERPSALELRQRLLAIEFDDPWNEERAVRWWDEHPPGSMVAPTARTPRPKGTVVPA